MWRSKTYQVGNCRRRRCNGEAYLGRIRICSGLNRPALNATTSKKGRWHRRDNCDRHSYGQKSLVEQPHTGLLGFRQERRDYATGQRPCKLFLSFVSVSEKQHESLPLSWRSSRSWLLRWKELGYKRRRRRCKFTLRAAWHCTHACTEKARSRTLFPLKNPAKIRSP